MGQHYLYECDCGIAIEAETWDPHELPRLWCPECGERIESRRDPRVYGKPSRDKHQYVRTASPSTSWYAWSFVTTGSS
jgi:hypothetical protein